MERTAYDELTDDSAQRRLPQHVKCALDFMRSNVAEKITLPGLATISGAPERTLLRQFKRFKLRERLAMFALELHPDKTRLIEFGRVAVERRSVKGLH